MSLAVKSVPIVTDGAGAASVTVRAGGLVLRAVRLELGTLSTPDITLTEEPGSTAILAVTGVAADTTWYPTVLGDNGSGVDVTGAALPIPVYDRILVVVAGGGATTTGRLVLMYER